MATQTPVPSHASANGAPASTPAQPETFARTIDPSKASGARPTRSHGTPPRGLNVAPTSPSFNGSFGRIFRTLPAARFGTTDGESHTHLMKLGEAMVSVRDTHDPKDGPDNEESGIPSAFTYFGQFVDHDMTFDPASSLQKQNDPDALIDFRTPRFDLDNLYGRGPDDEPYMYQADGLHFQLGDALTGAAGNANARDLARSPFPPNRALIGDPRNDENVIVSQLQGLWQRFHNALVDANDGASFAHIQQEVRFHYQWILIHDFLPRIIHAHALDAVLPGAGTGKPDFEKLHLRFYHPKNDLFMPVEFSVAAYRYGHSMVRPGYRLNDDVLVPIFAPGPGPNTDLRGFKATVPQWAMDWRRFVDLEKLDYGTPEPPKKDINKLRLQLAYKIDTSLVDPLRMLPPSIASDPPPSLAARNLLRGWRLGLPTGQAVARAMGLEPMHDDDLLIGKFTGDPADLKGAITDAKAGGAAFKKNCPLWTYILAETRLHASTVTLDTLNGPQQLSTPQLGPVGGTIVAETFFGILKGDKTSYINMDPNWKPTAGVAADGKFGLREMIAYAQAH